MTSKTSVQTDTLTHIGTGQKIALFYVVAVGIIVVGSVFFSAVYTWTAPEEVIETASIAPQYHNARVLGVDQTFTTLAE